MTIKYSNKKVMEICTDSKAATKLLGAVVYRKLFALIYSLEEANNLSFLMHMSRYRLHQLVGDRKDQYSLVIHSSSKYRLIIYPMDSDGNIIEAKENENERLIQTVMVEILEVSEHYDK